MKRHYKLAPLLLIIMISLSACYEKDSSPLPYLGMPEIVDGDTIKHKIPPFSLITQDSLTITNQDLSDNIYIADFFFMSCPTICPRVMQQMQRLYKHYENNEKIRFISHTLDPKRDTPERLKMYADNLEIDTKKWHFLTGDKDHIYDLAETYFVVAYEDSEAPGGVNHSGKILLVDTQGHIRGFAEGTDPEDVDGFFDDIDKLLAEYEAK